MIFISGNNNNQSEKNSNLIAKNDEIVSTESSLKKIVDVNDDDESMYHKILSDNSNTVSYDKLKFGDNTDTSSEKVVEKTIEKPEQVKATDKSLQKQMYQSAVKEKNSAQIEQDFENSEADTSYIPPLQFRGDYNLSQNQSSYAESNNSLVSTDSRMSDIVRSTAISDTYKPKPTKSNFKKLIKAKRMASELGTEASNSATANENYELVTQKSQFKRLDGTVKLDSNTANLLRVKRSLSKTNTDKIFSSSMYNQGQGQVEKKVSATTKQYKVIVKQNQIKKVKSTSSNKNSIASVSPDTSSQSLTSDNVSVSTASFSATSTNVLSNNQGQEQAQGQALNTVSKAPNVKKARLKASLAANAKQSIKLSKKSPDIKSASIKSDAAITLTTASTPVKATNATATYTTATNTTAKNKLTHKTPSMKQLFSNSCKDLVKTTTDKVYLGTKQQLYRLAKDSAATASDDNYEVRGVHAMYQVVETAKNSKKAVLGTSKAVSKGITTTAKAVKKTTKLAKSSKTFLKNVKKINFAKVRAIGKIKLKASATVLKNAVVGKAKAAIAAALASACGFLLLFIIIGGILMAIISMFTWQTSSVLDTTQLVKYISELDKKMQSDWYAGYTAVDIKKNNDKADAKQIQYFYYLAENKMPDTLPADTTDIDDSNFNCYIKVSYNPENGSDAIYQKGYTLKARSKDEMIETCRWTTDDYITALAYLQVKEENLGWFANAANWFGVSWVGENELKSKAEELHKLTYGNQIYISQNTKTGDKSYQLQTGKYYCASGTSASDVKSVCYFGRKNSVRFVIENNLISTPLTEEEMERFENLCIYGNSQQSVLSYPLEGDIDDMNIVKHFGKQMYLTFTPASDNEHYPSVSSTSGEHDAIDIAANSGDIIKSPISGYCKVGQQELRGFEYVISTSKDFEAGTSGYLCRISCSSSSFIPTNTVTAVKAGDSLGKVAGICGVNTKKPTVAGTDIFADYLYPCSTNTEYYTSDSLGDTTVSYSGEYIHLELYKLPCDFTSKTDMADNVLAPELFFKYPEPDN